MQDQTAPAATVSPSQKPDVSAPAVPAQPAQVRTLSAFLRWVVVHPAALPTLLLAWAFLFWLGSQIPQINSALTTQDGLSRHDLLLLDAQGWTLLPRGGLWWLLLVLTAIVLSGRWLFTAEKQLWQAELSLDKHERLRALLSDMPQLPRLWRAFVAKPTMQQNHGFIHGTRGTPKLLAGLWLSSGALALVQLTAAALEPQSVRLDVAVGQPLAAIDAWTVDGGSLSPAAGRWRGACTAVGLQLKCQFELPGAQHTATIGPGRPAEIDGNTLTWLSVAPAPVADNLDLTWQQEPDKPPLLLHLTPGQAQDAPTLRARLSGLNSHIAGPMALIVPENAPIIALISPIFAGAARAEIRPNPAQSGVIARLQWAPNRALWPWALVLLVAFAALVLDFTQIHAQWRVFAGDRLIVSLHSCSRAAWLQQFTSAIDRLRADERG